MAKLKFLILKFPCSEIRNAVCKHMNKESRSSQNVVEFSKVKINIENYNNNEKGDCTIRGFLKG